jgi:hypothetical protein
MAEVDGMTVFLLSFGSNVSRILGFARQLIERDCVPDRRRTGNMES